MNKTGPTTATLFATYLALLGLLAFTALASSLSPTWLSNSLSLFIALAKATLILLIFMELRYRSARYRVVALAGLFWLFFLLAITMSDYLTRGMVQVIGK